MFDEGLFDCSVAWLGSYHDDHWYVALFMDGSRVDQVKPAEGDSRKKHGPSRETP